MNFFEIFALMTLECFVVQSYCFFTRLWFKLFFLFMFIYSQKAINDVGFQQPTPIQCSTIPIALLGKDICACASTGTGKQG